MYVIVLSIILGALGLYYYIFRRMNHFKKYDIPHVKPLPILGNMAPLISGTMSTADFAKQFYYLNTEAKYVGVYEFLSPLILLRDPELIKSIGLKNFDKFPNHPPFATEEQDPLLSKNLLALRDEKWREVRTMLSPAFTTSKMKSMYKLMSNYAVDFANFVTQLPPEEKEVELKNIFTRYTSDVIASCAFGVNVDSMKNPNNLFYIYGTEATTFDNLSFNLKFYLSKVPLVARLFNVRLIREKIVNYFVDLIGTTIKTRDEKNIVRSDMLQLMMDSRGKNDGKQKLSLMDMTCQAFIFFFAGFETTSSLMCFAGYNIAVNKDVRKRLQDEIDQVLEDTKGEATYEAINNMEYLDAVLNEALRMYPSVLIGDRECQKDFELPPALPGAKPYTVKKGQSVWIPIHAIQNDPKYFEDPEKFNPERFLGEQKKHILNTGAYLPFGVGPRTCIGNRFALLETKALFFHLLARCDLLPCEKTAIPLKFIANDGFTMKPEGGFWLKAVPRKNPHHTIAVNNMNGTCDL